MLWYSLIVKSHYIHFSANSTWAGNWKISRCANCESANFILRIACRLSGFISQKLRWRGKYITVLPTSGHGLLLTMTRTYLLKHLLSTSTGIFTERKWGVHLFKKLSQSTKVLRFFYAVRANSTGLYCSPGFFGVNSTISQLHMSIEKHQATINGQPIYLSRKEFDVLYLLYSNPDIAFKKNRYMKRFGTKYLPVISTLLKIQCFKFEESAKRMEIAKVCQDDCRVWVSV